MKVQKTSDLITLNRDLVKCNQDLYRKLHPWTNICVCWTSRLNVRAVVHYNHPSIMHVLVLCDVQGCPLLSLPLENWHSPQLWRHSHLSPALLFKDSYLYLQLTYRTCMQTESNTALLLFRHVSHTPSSPQSSSTPQSGLKGQALMGINNYGVEQTHRHRHACTLK